MRLVAFIASICLATPAIADPAAHSRALYGTVAAGASTFAELLDRAATAPAEAAAGLVDEVRRPVNRADEAWMAAMIEAGPDVFLPFFPCRSAASSLEAMADDFAAFLLGETERPDIDLDLGYFREDFTRCELALDVDVTFPDVATALNE